MRETAEMTTRVDLDVGMRLGKRGRAHSAMDEEFEATNLSIRSQGSYYIYGKCVGSHDFACHVESICPRIIMK